MVAYKAGGVGGKWGVTADREGVSFWGDENSQQLDCNDSSTTL